MDPRGRPFESLEITYFLELPFKFQEIELFTEKKSQTSLSQLT